MRHGTVLCAVALLAVAAPVHAQTFGIAAATGYYAGTGQNYDGASGGLLLDGRLFYRSSRSFELDAGVSHAAFSFGVSGLRVDVPHWEVYLEPRFNFFLGSASPFLGVRAGWTRESVSALGYSASVNGYLAGAVAGFNLPLGNAVALELRGLAGYVKYGDVKVGGVTQSGSGDDGAVLGVSVGLRFVFPGKSGA